MLVLRRELRPDEVRKIDPLADLVQVHGDLRDGDRVLCTGGVINLADFG